MPSLADVAVTNEDLWMDDLAPYFLTGSTGLAVPEPRDATEELANVCRSDCVKLVWADGISNVVTLILIRARDEAGAQHGLAYEWEQFGLEDPEAESFYISDPYEGSQDPAWGLSRFDDNPIQLVHARVRGPVFMLLVYQVTVYFDIDAQWTMWQLEWLGHLQAAKLYEAGFPP